MSYQVLARKWRPRHFGEMVGQTHVLRAIINALDHGRLHHAYLFTGTRGVGKTTIARILAKSLNCETGVTSKPCGQCSACREIDEGRFVDLIEVDAASRTKVEDTRELLDNVQYAPTRGRYKVYLIDEVHMLSGHSFNALLKTLEEPPEHVKFLLATTDPQKLPITILSRCLQFSLKAMTPDRIVGHLKQVLDAEKVTYEESALWHLGRAADGSMRDAMSLTDQAIAFGDGQVQEADVIAMLGSIDREYVFALLDCLVAQDPEALLRVSADMAEKSPDYTGVLADLVSALHRIAVAQIAPDAVDDSDGERERVHRLATAFSAEDVQLFYQTALLGRRDLPLAPEPRSGFEMILLRMLLFKPQTPEHLGYAPVDAGQEAQGTTASAAPGRAEKKPRTRQPEAVGADSTRPIVEQGGDRPVQTAKPVQSEPPGPVAQQLETGSPAPLPDATVSKDSETNTAPAELKRLPDSKDSSWADWVPLLDLQGSVLNFARNCHLCQRDKWPWLLQIHPRHEALIQESHVRKIEAALQQRLGGDVRLQVDITDELPATPEALHLNNQRARREAAEQTLRADPFVQLLESRFGATMDKDSVRALP